MTNFSLFWTVSFVQISYYLTPFFYHCWASLIAQLAKNSPALQETWVRSLVGKIPWRRERLPSPVFWPGEFHGLYSPWGHRESDTTERLSLSPFQESPRVCLSSPLNGGISLPSPQAPPGGRQAQQFPSGFFNVAVPLFTCYYYDMHCNNNDT